MVPSSDTRLTQASAFDSVSSLANPRVGLDDLAYNHIPWPRALRGWTLRAKKDSRRSSLVRPLAIKAQTWVRMLSIFFSLLLVPHS
jgi:hypothetical protein